VLRDHTATVLLFRDSAMRRPIDVVAWNTTHGTPPSEPAAEHDNVIPLAQFARAARRRGCPTAFDTPPDGEAA
jgi:hypothetical protein